MKTFVLLMLTLLLAAFLLPTTDASCQDCTFYYPNALLSSTAPPNYGDFVPLTNHACGQTGDTSECCEAPSPDWDVCAIFWEGELMHPCTGCDGPEEPTDNNPGTNIQNDAPGPTPTNPPIELPEGTSDSGDCSTCTLYYPRASLSTQLSQRGDVAPLTTHACGYFSGETSECCLLSAEDGICGTFWDSSFEHPCTGCVSPTSTPSSVPSASVAPSFGPSETSGPSETLLPSSPPSASPSIKTPSPTAEVDPTSPSSSGSHVSLTVGIFIGLGGSFVSLIL